MNDEDEGPPPWTAEGQQWHKRKKRERNREEIITLIQRMFFPRHVKNAPSYMVGGFILLATLAFQGHTERGLWIALFCTLCAYFSALIQTAPRD